MVERAYWFSLSEPGQPYARKIERLLLFIGNDLHSLLVKIADVEDNNDPARLALLDEKTRARLERKYAPALVILREAAQRLGWTPPLSDASES